MYTMPFTSSSAGLWFSHIGSNVSCPLTLPFPVPATVAVITTGPPNFSLPVVTSRAWSRCTAFPPSWVLLTT